MQDHNKLKLELQKSYGVIDNLTLKNNTIKQNYNRVNSEKEHIITELRRLSTSSLPFSPVVTPTQRVPRAASLETINSEVILFFGFLNFLNSKRRIQYMHSKSVCTDLPKL